ncbi:MAG: AAA family ATPase, partial [Candidatus Aenigmarchaeota archaeon]|nr:AAA family ATPase [Candidatus Aenigmarchaeota archaeon]
MVKLDRLVMTNFKSFSGKVSIPFTKNLSMICGPNGAGKSNIMDAITFVIGTPRAKSIRADKLINLIFNGGRERKPADWCEVSMYLDNNDGQIPGEKEIKITRRITRSGVSIYKFNGKTVNRAKIVDILANVNISPDGHNIIMQGDVTRVIEMSPMERREIIDEISGISEFDDKKEKARRELEIVDSKVREMIIIVTE